MADKTCQPADSVTLYFGGGTAIGMIHVAWIEKGAARTALQLWQSRIRTWISSQLGAADSVRLAFNQSEVKAFWAVHAAWVGQLIIQDIPGPRNERFISVHIECVGNAPWCRAYYAR